MKTGFLSACPSVHLCVPGALGLRCAQVGKQERLLSTDETDRTSATSAPSAHREVREGFQKGRLMGRAWRAC